MTRIAILADIHGNLPALEAVQRDLARAAPDQVVVNGDVVNRGPQSVECVARIRTAGWPVVFGNHEDYVLKFLNGPVPEEWASDWWLPTRAVAEALSAEQAVYLRSLPRHYVIDVPGLPPVRCVHGSTRYLNEGLGEWMSDDELRDAVSLADDPVIVGAHTHQPYEGRVDGRLVLNCGAVGAPFNGDPAAQYLLLHGEHGTWRAEFRRVPYDRGAVYAAWDRSGHIRRSMAARIFRFEVETARFHMMAYVNFCERNDLSENDETAFDAYRRHVAAARVGHTRKARFDHNTHTTVSPRRTSASQSGGSPA